MEAKKGESWRRETFSSPPPLSPISNLLSPSPLGRPDTQAISFVAQAYGQVMKQFESLAATLLSDACQPEVDLHSWAVIILGQIVLITIIYIFIRVKTLSNTNYVASRYIKREKGSLPFDVRRSKTSLLNLPTSFCAWPAVKGYGCLRATSLQET